MLNNTNKKQLFVCLLFIFTETLKLNKMKTYYISVVCSDTTTFSYQIDFKTQKEAHAFSLGVQAVFIQQDKQIYFTNVKLKK